MVAAAHALVHDGVTYVCLVVRLLQRRTQHRVHLRRRRLVRRAERGEDLEQLDLHKRRGDAVVVVRLGQSVLHDLLEDGHERWDEIFMRGGIHGDEAAAAHATP